MFDHQKNRKDAWNQRLEPKVMKVWFRWFSSSSTNVCSPWLPCTINQPILQKKKTKNPSSIPHRGAPSPSHLPHDQASASLEGKTFAPFSSGRAMHWAILREAVRFVLEGQQTWLGKAWCRKWCPNSLECLPKPNVSCDLKYLIKHRVEGIYVLLDTKSISVKRKRCNMFHFGEILMQNLGFFPSHEFSKNFSTSRRWISCLCWADLLTTCLL